MEYLKNKNLSSGFVSFLFYGSMQILNFTL